MNKQTVYLKDYKPPQYQILEVALAFQLDEEYTLVESTLSVIRNKEVEATVPLLLQGEDLELLSLYINDKPVNKDAYTVNATELRIDHVPKQFNLKITTRIKPQENTVLSGLYKSSNNFCTQCEAEGFRRITYFLDRPDVMARFNVKIIADKKRYPILLSNGNKMESKDLENGQHYALWQDPFKKPSYLFALVAGDFEVLKDHFLTATNRRVALEIYVEKGNQDKCAHAMNALKKAMRFDEIHFGREYDLDIYMIVAVSDFNMGAMENKGLNIFNTKYILAKPETATDLDYIHIESVIAHEYFHNWTGNRITCRDWFQLSLKEGLTIFRDQSFTAHATSKTVARIKDVIALRTTQFPEDQGPLAHAVRPSSYMEINNFYTATIYNKGAEVIRMIQTLVGEEVFRKGMDLYFDRHDGQAVTIEDFVKCHEDASQRDLTQFRLWYSQAGTPVLTVTDYYDTKNKKYSITIKQMCPPTPKQTHKKPMHIPVKMGLLDQSGKELLKTLLEVTKEEEKFEFENINVKPIPSLLRDFSAPVKLNYAYLKEHLALLFKYDSDGFNRFDAGTRYAIYLITELMANEKTFCLTNEDLYPYRFIITNEKDKWLLTQMLTLPEERYLADQQKIVEVDKTHSARDYLVKKLAAYLKENFLHLYQTYHRPKEEYTFDIKLTGERYLKNLCLYYLMKLPDQSVLHELALRQFQNALNNNMSDTLAALSALIHSNHADATLALNEFYDTFKQEALVVNKWFAVQAGANVEGVLAKVQKLMQHPAFDLKNPNKVYALIGTYGANLAQFHLKSGEGYQFLTDVILKLNMLNPQVAARMVKPLTEWQRYDKVRQNLMYKELERLKSVKLSSDLYELVTKSLEA